MLSLFYAAMTLLMLACVLAAQRWGKPSDSDRLLFGLWLGFYWASEEAIGRAVGWESVRVLAPFFDFLTGAALAFAWAFRPAWWKAGVVLAIAAQCVGHVYYRTHFPHDAAQLYRYRVAINALYLLILSLVALPGVWDVVKRLARPRDRHTVAGGVALSDPSGPGGFR